MSSSLAHVFSSTACLAALYGVGVREEPYVVLAYTLRMSASDAHAFSLTTCFAALDGVGVGEEPCLVLAYTLRNV
jgi:hypothetical protein